MALFHSVSEAGPLTVRFRHLPPDVGLSQSVIQCIAQDRVGFLWFGTEDGLNRYDGYQFTVFRHSASDSFSISDNYIWRLLSSKSGDLWIGTLRGGLNRYEISTARFISYRNDPEDSTSLSNDNVTALFEDTCGTLWVGTWGDGLCRLDSGSTRFTRYRRTPNVPTGLPSNFVSSITQDSAGNLWIGTWEGLARLDPTRTSFTTFTNTPGDSTTLCNNMIWDIRMDRFQNLWIATREGLDRYDPVRNSFRHFRRDPSDPGSLSSNVLASLLEDSRGNLWAGTYEGGVCLFDRETNSWITYKAGENPAAGPIKGDVLSIAEDRSGTVWFGTSGGVSCFDPQADKFLQHRTLHRRDLALVNIRSIKRAQGGGVWIGMNGHGVAHLDDRFKVTHTFRHSQHDAGTLTSDQVLSVHQQRDGTLWVGTLGHGLNRLPPGSKRFIHFMHNPLHPGSLSDNTVIALAEDRQGNLWAGTNGGGLNRFDTARRTFVRYRFSDSPGALGGNWVWSLFVDTHGALWVGTWTRGLYRYDQAADRFEPFVSNPEDSTTLSNNSILSMAETGDGQLWIGTHGGGLNRFDPATRRFRTYTERHGLPNDVIMGILPDEQGNLWLSTNRGISMFNPSTGRFRNYDVDDGLQSNEFDHGAYFVRDDGTMLFGGIAGLNIFHPRTIRDNAFVPPVVLTGFSVFDKTVALPRPAYLTENIRLSHREGFFSFTFAALNYSASKKNRYVYRLEGLDPDWVNAGTRGVAYYTNVPPGEYVFRVKGSNNDGVWNDAGVHLMLVVDPPFWGTAWFKTLFGGALLALLVTLYRSRARRWERDQRIQREFSFQLMRSQETERKRIAGELHDSLVQNLLIVKNRALLGQQASHDPRRASKEFSEITAVISSAIDEVRGIAHNLRPYQLDRLGLTRALRSLVESLNAASSTLFTASIDSVDGLFTPDGEILVYRIVQEATNNILKHAAASTASMTVATTDGAVEIAIRDNGKGLGTDAGHQNGFGLTNVEQRVRMMGGAFAIHSATGLGTTLIITIPVRI